MKKKYLTILLLFIFSISYSSQFNLNRGEIREQIRNNIRDSVYDNYLIEDATINNFINISQDEIVRMTDCIEITFSTMAVSGQQEYDFPDNYRYLLRVGYNILYSTPPAYYKLDWKNLGSLDSNLYWQNQTAGKPLEYYEKESKYGLHPKPSAVYCSTYSIQLVYKGRADELTSDSDEPFNSIGYLSDYTYLIIDGAEILCRRLLGEDTTALENKYYAKIELMRKEIQKKPDATIKR
ncbi:MAG: hypothetical protein PHY08_09020 [Candidatus Cloacimonetes bacterium]|nr:hypothetical protein [Candidatus Cloacimonadota bacterium]